MGTSGRVESILVVSEDAHYIVQMQETLRQLDVRGCLGPASTPCRLTLEGVCPLTNEADLILVDSPPAGAFLHEWASMSAGKYAERLARLHPQKAVLLCGAQGTKSVPIGNAVHIDDRIAALARIEEMLSERV